MGQAIGESDLISGQTLISAAAWLAFTALTATAQDDGTVLVVPVDQLDRYWTLTEPVVPRYPYNAGRKGLQGCTTVGFIIEPDGSTSSFQVVSSWPDDIFADAAVKAAHRFSFEPAADNPEHEPVYTTYTFTFQFTRNERVDTEVHDSLTGICMSKANLAGGPG